MQEPRRPSSNGRHYQQIRINGCQSPYTEYSYQDKKPQEHHADRQQHRRHIFGCFLGGYFPTFTRQYGYGGSAAVQPAYNAGYQNTGLAEYISFQQIRKIGDARNHHRSQPYTVRREVDARYQIVVGQHREDDTADGKELGKRNHFVVLHPLCQFGKRMFQLGKEQYGHNYHYIEPGGLRSNDRCNAIRNERNDNGSDSEHMKLRLLDVIIQGKQQPQDSPATHKQAIVRRVENVEEIAQNADKGESTVRTEQGRLSFALQTDTPQGKTYKQRKHRHQDKSDEFFRQVLVQFLHIRINNYGA